MEGGKIEKFGMAAFVCVFNRDFSKVLMIKRNEEKIKKYGCERFSEVLGC